MLPKWRNITKSGHADIRRDQLTLSPSSEHKTNLRATKKRMIEKEKSSKTKTNEKLVQYYGQSRVS